MLLQLTLSPEDLANAPEVVRDWFHRNAGLHPSTHCSATAASCCECSSSEPTLQDAIAAAGEFLKSHSLDSLADILSSMGLNRVSECPREHIPELLSRMTTA